MSNLIKKIKIKKQDDTFTDYIPIGAEAENVNVDGESVETKLNKKPYYYDNVAAMKADTKLKVGDMAITLGYYEPNDGGSAEYSIIDTSTGTVDDGGSYHELDSGLFAELIIKQVLEPGQFGCYGDDSHDDTNKIQACINYCINNNLKLVSAKNKIYKITETLQITAPIFIDFNFAIIKAYQNDIAIEINYSTPNELNYYIKNIVIDCNFVCNKGLVVSQCRRTLFETIKIINFNQYGMYFGGEGTVGGSRIKDCQITNTNNPINGAIALGVKTADLFVDGLDWVNVWGGIYKEDSGTSFFNNCHGFIANNMNILYPNSFFFKVSASANCMITNCYPDTQQYGFIITPTEAVPNPIPRLKICDMQTFMNKSVLTKALQDTYGTAYLFYAQSVDHTKRITITNSNITGSIYDDDSLIQTFCNLNDNYIKVNTTTYRNMPINRTGIATTLLPPPSTSRFTEVSSNVRCVGDTTFINFELIYNPSVQGKLPRDLATYGGTSIGRLSSGILTSDIQIFGKAYYGTKNEQGQILLKGEAVCRNEPIAAATGSSTISNCNICVTATGDEFTNNKGLCDDTDNTNFTIIGSIVIPANNM